jgi:hypothetical protein
MSLVLPTRGPAGSGLWKDTLDAALTLLDAHDHTTGKGVRVPSAGLNVNADISFASLYAPTNLHRLSFASVTTLTSNNKSLFVSSSDNELYFRNNSGTNIKLTSGTSLNVAAFTGGIGGDYASVGAEVAFDDAGDRYTFKQNSATGWARLACGEVRILETGSSETVYVGLAAPAALASSHTITLPLAAPGSTSLVQLDSSGVLSASNTVANAATFSTSVTTPTLAGTPNFTGAVTMASTLGVTGLITATAGATAAANQHVTVSGTGAFKHGLKTKTISALSGKSLSSADAWTVGNAEIRLTGALQWKVPITMSAGERILAARARVKDSGGTQVNFFLSKFSSDDTLTDLAGAQVSDNTGVYQTLTQSSINNTASSGDFYQARFTLAAGAGNWTVLKIEVDYDRP